MLNTAQQQQDDTQKKYRRVSQKAENKSIAKNMKGKQISHQEDQNMRDVENIDDELRPFDRQNKINTLFMFLIPLVIFDMVTKEYLFDLTLPVLVNIRENYATKQLDLFFTVVSQFGDKIGFVLANVASYYFLDLEKSFTVALINYSSIALLSILKSANHEARPFHVADVQPSKCTFEYGNPSGHALWTMSVYLTIFDLTCQQNDWKYGSWKHTTSFVMSISVIFVTCFSRIWHAVHTFNQLFSGLVWGYGLYYLYCYILYYEIRRFVKSIRTRSLRKLVFNFGTKNFFILMLMGTAMYFIGSYLNPQPQEWQDKILQNCGDQLSKAPNQTTDPELYNFEKFLVCLGILGNYLGIIIEQRYMGTHVYPLWNQVSFGKQILLLLLTAPAILITSSGNLIIDKSKHSYLFVMIFKNIMPVILGNLHLFSVQKWFAIKTGLINKNGKKVEEQSDKTKYE